MRLLAFSGRTAKEILRDPLNLFFGLGFPSCPYRFAYCNTGKYSCADV